MLGKNHSTLYLSSIPWYLGSLEQESERTKKKREQKNERKKNQKKSKEKKGMWKEPFYFVFIINPYTEQESRKKKERTKE